MGFNFHLESLLAPAVRQSSRPEGISDLLKVDISLLCVISYSNTLPGTQEELHKYSMNP